MKRKKRRCIYTVYLHFIIVICLFIAPRTLVKASVSDGSFELGKDLFYRATDVFYNQNMNNRLIRVILDESKEAFTHVQNEFQRHYWLARVEYLCGIVERSDKREKAAEQRFLASLSLIQKALKSRDFSDGYRLLADNYAQLMIVNGIVYKMTNGKKIKKLSEKAIEIDPRNPKAYLTLALYYMNAPGFAGGNLDKCIDILHSLNDFKELEKVDRFSVNAWLGIAYMKKKERNAATRYLRLANKVYPGNTWLSDMLQDSNTLSGVSD